MFNKRDLIVVNVINIAILIILSVFMFIFSMNILLFIGLSLAWSLFVISINRKILYSDTDIVNELKRADKSGKFSWVIRNLTLAISSVEFYKTVFENREDSVVQTYNLISQKVYSKVRSAIKWMSCYDLKSNPPTDYIENLCGQVDALIKRLNKLNELVIQIDDETIEDVDISYADAMLASLIEMLDD